MRPTMIPTAHRSRRRHVLALACLVALAAACGSSPNSDESPAPPAQSESAAASSVPTAPTEPTAASPPAAEAATITIDSFTFNTPATVPAGAEIAVTNSDPAEHSVTADAGDAFNVEIEGGQTATFTAPTEPGSYPFFCTYHPSMRGTLVVQ